MVKIVQKHWPPAECANIECSNRIGGGPFVTVHRSRQGGRRTLLAAAAALRTLRDSAG